MAAFPVQLGRRGGQKKRQKREEIKQKCKKKGRKSKTATKKEIQYKKMAEEKCRRVSQLPINKIKIKMRRKSLNR